jgi:hypothetical protein
LQWVKRTNAAKPRHVNDHAACERDRAAGKTGASTTRRNGYVMAVTPGEDSGDLVCRYGLHDRVRGAGEPERPCRIDEIG